MDALKIFELSTKYEDTLTNSIILARIGFTRTCFSQYYSQYFSRYSGKKGSGKLPVENDH